MHLVKFWRFNKFQRFLSCRLVERLFLPRVVGGIAGDHRMHSFELSFRRLSSPTLFSFSVGFGDKY